MKRIIRIKIDVTKIDKSALYKGAKGTYLDATLFLNDEPGEYGDNGMIAQDLGKERREAGEKGAILGNGTIIKIIDEGRPAQPSLPPEPAVVSIGEEDDIPF
jgi:Ser-tRNA(Ala) deacylase AlaX